MRKLAISLALASTALASPALARDDTWYVGAEAGVMVLEDIDYDVNAFADAQVVDSKVGSDFGGNVGYDFGGFRLEAEVAYKFAYNQRLYLTQTSVPSFQSNGALVLVSPAANAQRVDRLGGKTTALSFMINGMADFGDDDGIQGFLGGGVGIARVKADDYRITDFGSYADDSDTVFAYQAIAGVRAPLTDNIDATLKYRYFDAADVKLVDVAGRQLAGRFRSHSILGGFTFNFGEPEVVAPPPPPPPPPEVAPPPPPPPPPPVVCSPGPYIVFFDWDKSDIKPEAASILDDAVAKYQTCGNAQVMLAGHADRSGSTTYNVGLSERRNASVTSYLTGRGVPQGVITSQGFGESRPRVETADGVREVQNRRVEITYGPGSGM
ncbi:MAG: OmpA family protein [Pseudomonadota bacterium]